MNLKTYEKTRYQNIYRHKKNKNYIVKINVPVDTTISNINGNKILRLEDALKIRDNPKIKIQKEKEIKYQDTFDDLFQKYIYCCKYEKKLSYNTWHKKEILYNAHLKNKVNLKISKINKDFLVKFINSLNTSDKEKNEIMSQLTTFFNWCILEEYIIYNPMKTIKKFKVDKPKMKYWEPKELKQFMIYVNNCIENNIDKEIAYRMKMLVLIGFSLGDRIGETRALTFNCIDENKSQISIIHSINYDTKSNDFISNTKNYWSQREITISQTLIKEIKKYQLYLKSLGYNINDESLIFFNYRLNKPFSDVALRKQFKKYCVEAKVSDIRMYDLRHTYVATMMAEGKELYLFSERIGHINYSTTVNKYGHLSNKVRKEMAELTDKFL